MPGPSFTLNGRFLTQSVTGVQRVAREVLMELDRLAQAQEIAPPQLFLPAKGDLVAPPDLKAITPKRVGRWGGHLWEQAELPRFCGPEPLLCLGNTAPLSRLRAKGKPVVTMVHDLSYKYFPSAYSWKFRALYGALIPQVLRHSDRVVTVSKAEQGGIETHYPFLKDSGRLSFLQNGGLPDAAAKAAFAADVAGPETRGYGLYLGSLTRRKNAEGVMRAAIDFLERYPEMRFVVIGASGASFEGVTVNVPPALAERLEFWGQINDAKRIYKACAGARFLLFPSFYEASPLPPIEAMTFGCPVIASQIPSLSERCGEAAVYCAPKDQAAIAAAIDTVMQPDMWYRYGKASRQQAARYSWAAQTKGLIALCEAVA